MICVFLYFVKCTQGAERLHEVQKGLMICQVKNCGVRILLRLVVGECTKSAPRLEFFYSIGRKKP